MTNTDNSKAPVKHRLDIVKPKKAMGLPHKPHIKSRTPMEGLVDGASVKNPCAVVTILDHLYCSGGLGRCCVMGADTPI